MFSPAHHPAPTGSDFRKRAKSPSLVRLEMAARAAIAAPSQFVPGCCCPAAWRRCHASCAGKLCGARAPNK